VPWAILFSNLGPATAEDATAIHNARLFNSAHFQTSKEKQPLSAPLRTLRLWRSQFSCEAGRAQPSDGLHSNRCSDQPRNSGGPFAGGARYAFIAIIADHYGRHFIRVLRHPASIGLVAAVRGGHIQLDHGWNSAQSKTDGLKQCVKLVAIRSEPPSCERALRLPDGSPWGDRRKSILRLVASFATHRIYTKLSHMSVELIHKDKS